MANSPGYVCFSKTGIDAKTVAATLLGTTENGTERFVPVSFTVISTNTDTVTGAPTLSMGTNGASYNNLVSAGSVPYSGLNADNKFILGNFAGTTIAPDTGLYLNISAGATAVLDTYTVTVFGYYI